MPPLPGEMERERGTRERGRQGRTRERGRERKREREALTDGPLQYDVVGVLGSVTYDCFCFDFSLPSFSQSSLFLSALHNYFLGSSIV